MGHLWSIIQDHLDRYGVREAAFARRLGTAPQTLNSWKKRGLRQLPDRSLLEAVARETGTPYDEVLDAVLRDIGYKDDAPAKSDVALAARPGVSKKRSLLQAQDEAAESSQDIGGEGPA